MCLAGASAGLHVSQKNDYPITVLRGHSISEIILSKNPIGFTGIDRPAVVLVLAAEGAARRNKMLATLPEDTLVLRAADVDLPPCRADIVTVDFKGAGIRAPDRALAALSLMAQRPTVISKAMLQTAIDLRFRGKVRESAAAVARKINESSAI